MTFRPERYPPEWAAIRARVMARAEHRCECAGECGDPHEGGRCDAPHLAKILRKQSAPWRWSRAPMPSVEFDAEGRMWTLNPPGAVTVVLTVAHLDHNEASDDETRLRALCQRCHLRYDADDNARRRRENARAKRAAGELPGMGER